MESAPLVNSNKKRVYLITNHQSGDILLNILQNLPFISEVKIGSPNVIAEMTESFLSNYDCIIYDLCDGGFGKPTEKIEQIKTYLENDGGSFLITHDHWDYNKGPLDLIGLVEDKNFIWQSSNKAKINIYPNEHDIYSSYEDLSHFGMIDIETTHQTYHRIKEGGSAKIIMELHFNNASSIKHDYLVVNEVGRGRIAYWAAGHSNKINENEKKLFVNIIAWLTKYKK